MRHELLEVGVIACITPLPTQDVGVTGTCSRLARLQPICRYAVVMVAPNVEQSRPSGLVSRAASATGQHQQTAPLMRSASDVIASSNTLHYLHKLQ